MERSCCGLLWPRACTAKTFVLPRSLNFSQFVGASKRRVVSLNCCDG